MRIKFREGTILGDTYIIPAFDFDYEKAKQEIPAAFNTTGYNTNGIVDISGERFEKFRVVSDMLYKYLPANIPRPLSQYGDDGLEDAILPMNTNIQDGHIFDWATKGDFEEIEGGEPADFHTNPHYVFVRLTHPSNCYSDMRPTQSYRVQSDSWYTKSTGYTNLLDKKGKFGKIIYTDAGGHMSVFQNMYFETYWQPKPVLIGNGPQAGSVYGQNAQNKVVYAVCNRSNTPLVDSQSGDNRYRMYYNEYNTLDGSLQSNIDSWQNKPQSYFFIHYTVNGEEMYGVCYAQFSGYGDADYPTRIGVIALGSDWWGGSIIPGGGGGGSWGSDTVIGGGQGVWTFPSDDRGDTTGATVAAIATTRRTALQAFYTASHGYQIHQILPNEMQNIFGLLYDDSFFSRYTQSMFNPLSAVISLHLLPTALCNPTATKTALTLSGYDVSANLPTPQNFPLVDCMHAAHIGSLDIAATDTFIDYAPYTRAYLHLPYVGVLDIDINAIAAGSISVDYLTDAMTGNCAAYVTCIDRDGHAAIKYCATGNCAYSLPMFSAAQDGAAVGKIVSSTLGLAMSAITGNPSTALSAVGGIAGGLFDAATSQRNTQITGTIGGNPGMISDTQCYLEIVRPVWANPQHYQQLDGLPSLLSGTITAFNEYGDAYTGYIRVVSLETDGIQAAQDELIEIETLLRSGIFINDQ